MNIPNEAIRAAHDAAGSHQLTLDDMEAALEAAAPFMASTTNGDNVPCEACNHAPAEYWDEQ